ncbi:hypothetical protein EV187_0100 [Agromyces ramosus]|uniref:Ribosomally synthesized peptide with SipW-like signal peptide n=1 Tax=Agromyces ramosus TaxID=33879 RepID=A0A4Q7MM32_9MICO|nr:hypothetical protein [Agromyces ramosus]RZS67679.1 hypothetical protein EV187_0100 [Agromyces ramosus]
MSIQRIAAAATAALAAVALALAGASPAVAGSPHFIRNATTASLDGVSLVVDFKEAGLEAGAVETIQVTAHLDALYQCVNNGGKVPSDPKKTTISSDVSESDEFTAAKNGNLVGTLTVDPPDAASVLDCPSGQRSTLVSVTWSDVIIDDLTSGASLALTGTFSA